MATKRASKKSAAPVDETVGDEPSLLAVSGVDAGLEPDVSPEPAPPSPNLSYNPGPGGETPPPRTPDHELDEAEAVERATAERRTILARDGWVKPR